MPFGGTGLTVGPRQSTPIAVTDTLVEEHKLGLDILQLCTIKVNTET